MTPIKDPIHAAIEAHQQAYAALDKTVDKTNANVGDKLAHEENLGAFDALDRSCRRLVAAEFKTIAGLIALLNYIAPLLQEPGTPAMPLEVHFENEWEEAFGVFCANLAKSVAGILTAEADISPERVDFVGDGIIAAAADIDIFDDIEHARLVARAAIEADAEYRAGARS